MELRDRISRFQNYALTNATSLYNEDSRTAQQLAIQSANKIKECLLAVEDLTVAIENIQKYLKMEYAEESEEIVLTIEQSVKNIKDQVNASYVSIFNEDAMTTGELAGCTAKAVNECLKAINMLADLVLDISDNVITYDIDGQMLILGGDNNA